MREHPEVYQRLQLQLPDDMSDSDGSLRAVSIENYTEKLRQFLDQASLYTPSNKSNTDKVKADNQLDELLQALNSHNSSQEEEAKKQAK